MRRTEDLIITVSPTGGFQGKEENPALPYLPEEIAETVYDCWNEGAAIAHIHCREKDGTPSNDPMVFSKVDRLIREKGCDIIIQHSTSPGKNPHTGVEDGMRTIEANPEMASLSMGVGMILTKGQVRLNARSRTWLEEQANKMRDKGIKPELEVYNMAMVEDVYYLIAKGLIERPYWISFIMGMHRINQNAIRYSPKALLYQVEQIPQDGMFSVIGIGPDELPATTLSILLGGHCRVGFEDNIYYHKGELAKSNAQLVSRTARIARELGCKIASPDTARKMLNIPPLKESGR
ncbi:MAG TPA: 3-keto-5-aminohexanoate cleavage protein [Syntrophorhabdaceae bacterium]|nr:3-keto-5-aminohexanoate cleavage protein [Syntrophorhabdaceae bacterium]